MSTDLSLSSNCMAIHHIIEIIKGHCLIRKFTAKFDITLSASCRRLGPVKKVEPITYFISHYNPSVRITE